MVAGPRRREMYAVLHQALGEGPAEELIEMLAPLEHGELARQSDLLALREDVRRLRGEIAEIRSDVTELRSDVTELRSDVTGLARRIDYIELRVESRIDNLGVRFDSALIDVRAESTELRGDIAKLIPRFMMANMAMIFAGTGMLLAAVKLG